MDTIILLWLPALMLLLLSAILCGDKKQQNTTRASRAKSSVQTLKPQPPQANKTTVSPSGDKNSSVSVEKKVDDPKSNERDEKSQKLSQKSKKGKGQCAPQPGANGDDKRFAWVSRVINMTCKQISKEYKEKIQRYKPPDMKCEAHDANPVKNRRDLPYTDVYCLDSTRIVLKERPKKDDYIHASYITVPDGGGKYICAQGPMPETIEDFWCMVMQEKPKLILMLCNLLEEGAEKCAKYYPDKKGQTEKYGSYTVVNTEIKKDPMEGVMWSVLDITHKDQTFQTNHLLITWWPDHLAPSTPTPAVDLINWIKKNNEKDRPVLVHCSAGVGRTATLVGIEYANVRLKSNPDLSIGDIVKEMRGQRYQAVQSHIQYLCLHVCLLEYLIQDGVVKREGRVKEFMDEYTRHVERKLAKVREGEDKDKENE